MKWTRGQKLFVLVAVLINAAVWIIPSNVVELVARDRQTLLGRYSREHFAWIIALIPITIVTCWIHVSRDSAVKKRKAFKLVAALLVLVPSVLALDVYLRLKIDWGYELGELAYHRTPGWKDEGVYVDKPEALRTYPDAPPGYGDVHYLLTTDDRGYRNHKALGASDVVVLGDSFAEGSRVSDEDAWPQRLAELSGRTVYNLGMSGYAPQHYLASYREVGAELKPQQVLCLIYEGNDFRSAKPLKEAPKEWMRLFKRSPIREAIDNALIRTFGPIGADRRVPGMDILSWMPIAYPSGADARYYAFPPSFIEWHYKTRKGFDQSKYWKRFKSILTELCDACRADGSEFVLVYAPSKPHVVLPLVGDTLPADKVSAFAALRADYEMPAPKEYLSNLMASLDVEEDLLAGWCKARGIRMVSLTEPLREAVRQGRQPYYTYDEHWTPVGHEVAAEVINGVWLADAEATKSKAGTTPSHDDAVAKGQ